MAQNHVQPGFAMPVTLAAKTEAGDPVLVGTIFGVALNSGDNGDTIEVATEQVWRLAKANPQVITQGAVLYWDAANGVLTNDDDSAANPRAGVAFAAAASTDTHVLIKLG